MTDEEKQAVAALTRLLQDEIAQISRGELAQVTAQVARKSDLAAQVEAAGPAIAAALVADPPDEGLIAQIATLRDVIDTNATLLDHMAQATGSLVAEVARIRDRHGLRGIYGAKGAQRAGEPMPVPRFDRSV